MNPTSIYTINEDWEKQISLDPILRDSVVAAQKTNLFFGLRQRYTKISSQSGLIQTVSNVHRSSVTQENLHRIPLIPRQNIYSASPRDTGYQPQSFAEVSKEKKINSTIQFLEWFEKLESDISFEQDVEINQMKADLELKSKLCQDILDTTNDILSMLNSALDAHKKISDQEALFNNSIRPFFDLKESKYTTQRELEEGLMVFNSLEEISKLFNSPGNNVCTDRRFIPFLKKADLSIAFLKKHRYLRDGELYLLRFQQSQARALTLIKMHFFQKIKELSPLEKPLSTSYPPNLNKFRSAAVELHPLLSEMEQRVEHISEANYLLFSMYKLYFSTRKHILTEYITEKLDIIKNNQKNSLTTFHHSSTQPATNPLDNNNSFNSTENSLDVSSSIESMLCSKPGIGVGMSPDQEKVLNYENVSLAKMLHSWCTFIFNICSNEYLLLGQFFNTNINFNATSYDKSTKTESDQSSKEPTPQQQNFVSLAASMFLSLPNNYLANQLTSEMIAFLESFLSILYDNARPLIISEQNINVLSSYSIVLQSFGWASAQYTTISTRNSLDYSRHDERRAVENGTGNSSSEADVTIGLSMDLCTTTFYSVIDKLLGDTLHRLVFRIQKYVEIHITNYAVTDSDCCYIEEWYNSLSKSAIKEDNNQRNSLGDSEHSTNVLEFENISEDLINNTIPKQLNNLDKITYVFPPIRHTIWILEKIKESLTKNLIHELSSESIIACKMNITTKTAKLISENFPNSPMAHSFVKFSLKFFDLSLKSIEY